MQRPLFFKSPVLSALERIVILNLGLSFLNFTSSLTQQRLVLIIQASGCKSVGAHSSLNTRKVGPEVTIEIKGPSLRRPFQLSPTNLNRKIFQIVFFDVDVTF